MPDKVKAAMDTMERNLEEKTGKSLPAWIAVARALGPRKHGEIVQALKQAHGLGHGYANLIAHGVAGFAGAAAPPGDDLLAAQYAGEKAALRPLYDALVAKVSAFGADVELSPKKTYVSLRRAKQFGLIQASTKARLDVGIHLPDTKPTARLEASGSFNAMVSHRVRVESLKEIDAELVKWLKAAYARA
jgi:hypothetical protein